MSPEKFRHAQEQQRPVPTRQKGVNVWAGDVREMRDGGPWGGEGSLSLVPCCFRARCSARLDWRLNRPIRPFSTHFRQAVKGVGRKIISAIQPWPWMKAAEELESSSTDQLQLQLQHSQSPEPTDVEPSGKTLRRTCRLSDARPTRPRGPRSCAEKQT